jgi:hypothetical protein
MPQRRSGFGESRLAHDLQQFRRILIRTESFGQWHSGSKTTFVDQPTVRGSLGCVAASAAIVPIAVSAQRSLAIFG